VTLHKLNFLVKVNLAEYQITNFATVRYIFPTEVLEYEILLQMVLLWFLFLVYSLLFVKLSTFTWTL